MLNGHAYVEGLDWRLFLRLTQIGRPINFAAGHNNSTLSLIIGLNVRRLACHKK
jgi:hypothetical protein